MKSMETRINGKMESLAESFRAMAKRRTQERREARGIKLDMRDMWSTEESESL